MTCAMATKVAASFLQRKAAFPVFNLNLRRLCVATTSENEEDKLFEETTLKMREEEKKRMRQAGKQLHAVYHIKVNEIAQEFLMKRQEEKKHLNNAMFKNEDLRQLDKEIHDRVVESVKLENERIEQLR